MTQEESSSSNAEGATQEAFAFSAEAFQQSFPSLLLVVDSQRRIVHANNAFLEFLGIEGGEAAVKGKLPGEAFGCLNCKRRACACGETEACRKCGAFVALAESLGEGKRSSGVCHMSRDVDGRIEAVDLRICCNPLELRGERFVSLSAVDIGAEIRRDYLESGFLNDIRASAGNVMTIGGLLNDECAGTPASESAKMLLEASTLLMAEIDGHRMLVEAERGVLKVDRMPFSSVQLLERLAADLSSGYFSQGRKIAVSPNAVEIAAYSDPAILYKALWNLARNALEASTPGSEARLSCEVGSDWNQAAFTVWNEGGIDPDVQLQIFHRSFSTKAAAKGVGTYMSRLLVENYLDGGVSFESSKEHGTLFSVRIPLGERGDEGGKASR